MVATKQECGDEPWLPCLRFTGAPGYDLGLAIGKRFRVLIRSRLASDPALHSDMLPFAATEEGHQLVAALTAANRYSPSYTSLDFFHTFVADCEIGNVAAPWLN